MFYIFHNKQVTGFVCNYLFNERAPSLCLCVEGILQLVNRSLLHIENVAVME